MKKTCERYAEKAMGWLGTVLIYFFMACYYMANRRKNRKFPAKTTTTVAHAKPKKKRMVKVLPKVNIMNCYPPNKFRVVSQPAKWDTGGQPFVYLDRIGKCVGTERIYGAKLQFDTGETVCIPFENLEPAAEETTNKIETPTAPVVAQEVELVREQYYKLVRKPVKWDSDCKYLGEIGKCIKVDDRGARLRFADGNDISFQADVLEVAPAIDLSNVIPVAELTEDDIEHDGLYQIVKAPEKFGEGKQLVGRVGKAKWPNYRGVCLKFPDKSSYVIPYDCIVKFIPPVAPNPIPVVQKLNASNIVIGRKYKVKHVPGDWADHVKRCTIGKFAEVLAATDIQKAARMRFPNKLERMVPFDCIEDLPRPTEEELIALIQKHPGDLLRIIQQINAVTRLKPVKDFCSTGLLPYCKEEAVTVYGPQLPVQHSAALLLHTSSPDLTDEAIGRIATMFDAEDAVNVSKVTPAPAPIAEGHAAED